MSSPTPPLQPATAVVALGRPAVQPGSALVTPVAFTSSYTHGGEVVYGRAGSPNWESFEEILGTLEGGQALTFASGMAAAGAAFELLPIGGTIVAPVGAYNGVDSLLRQAESRGRCTVRWVEVDDADAIDAELPGADLLWLESPTNPLLRVADIGRASAAARAAGALVVVDNTFATPLLQRPLDLGADVVIHSATKYLSGHSDVLLGATVCRDPELLERLLATRTYGGGIPGAMEAWLATRGLRTLAVRFERACTNAAVLAERLAEHAAVETVRYPGFGAMISFDVAGGAEAADRVCAAARLVSHSTSLGGVESQWERRRAIPNEPASTPVNLIRLSVGIEDVRDLWADVDAALRAAQ